ncbi:MAG: ATP synthase subunit I [Acidiferrobacterales bacterium]
MSYAAEILSKSIRRVLFTQLLLTLAVAAAYLAIDGLSGRRGPVPAALFGGAAALASTWFLGRRVRRASEPASLSAGGQLAFYAGAAPRFVVTIVLLGIGMGWLKLAPVPLIVAFGLAQFGFVINLFAAGRPRG